MILNTASQAGVDGPPNMPAYTASKSAVIGLTKTASKDLAPLGITVNALSPAFVGDCMMWDRQCELQAAADSQYYDKDPKVVSEQMPDIVNTEHKKPEHFSGIRPLGPLIAQSQITIFL